MVEYFISIQTDILPDVHYVSLSPRNELIDMCAEHLAYGKIPHITDVSGYLVVVFSYSAHLVDYSKLRAIVDNYLTRLRYTTRGKLVKLPILGD